MKDQEYIWKVNRILGVQLIIVIIIKNQWIVIFLNIYIPVNYSGFPSQTHIFIDGDYLSLDNYRFFPKLC